MQESNNSKAQRMTSHILKLLQHFPEGGLTFEELFSEEDYDEQKIRRDLKDIRKVTQKLGWRFNRPNPGRPARGKQKKYSLSLPFIPEFNDKETLLNLLMIKRLEKRPLASRSSDTKRQFELLQRLLQQKLFADYIEKMRDRVIFMEPEFQNKDDISDKLNECMDALAHEQKLCFEYSDRNRAVWPLGLICKEERWYLRAYCCEAESQRTYRLDRMTGVKKTNDKYEYPADFSLQELTQSAWSVLFEKKEELITVKFNAYGLAAEEIINTRFHFSQQVEQLPDGGIRATYELDTWKGMIGWILRWGHLVEVLEPAELRTEIKGIAEKIVATYSKTYQ